MCQRKIILRADPIQISIINAHAYFSIFLWHGNNVGNPIKVSYGGKQTDFQLLFHFFFELQDSLRLHHLKGLPYWGALKFN